MSRIVGGLLSLLDDVGVGAVALFTAVIAGAVGVVATLHVTGGTPYTKDDIDRASQISAAQAPATVPESTAEEDAAAAVDVAAYEQELEDARKRAERLQRESDGFSEKWDVAQRQIVRLREQIAELRALQEGAVGPDGLPLGGSLPDGEGPGGEGTGAGEPGPTDVTATGTLLTTWNLTEADKPWPARCGVPQESYAVRVVAGEGDAGVATGRITGSQLVKRQVKGGSVSLVCELSYEAVVPLPTKATYEFQAVAAGRSQTPLYSALVPGPVVATGNAPRLVVSYCPSCS